MPPGAGAGRPDRGRAALGRLLCSSLRRLRGHRGGGLDARARADRRHRRTGRDGAVVPLPRSPAEPSGHDPERRRPGRRSQGNRLPGRSCRPAHGRPEPEHRRLVPRLRAAPDVLPRDEPAPRTRVRGDLQRDRRRARGAARSRTVRRADRGRHLGLRGRVLVRVQPLGHEGDRAEPGPGRAHRAVGGDPGRTRRGPPRGRRASRAAPAGRGRSTTPWPRGSPASSPCSRPRRPASATPPRPAVTSTWRWSPRGRTWPRPAPWSPRSPRPRWRRARWATACTASPARPEPRPVSWHAPR